MSVPLPHYRKKLIEVALPLEVINKESSREKSIRHGHPSTLHLWWARRPLAACRAVLFASLVDDPSAWPELFPTEEKQRVERERIFKIIEELVVWENSNNPDTLFKAHTEIARSISRNRGDKMPAGAEAIRKYIAEHAPPVLDPFCGGGSIPLEAQRLGLEAHGSDLNPVAALITKALIEIPPKFAGKPPVNPEARAQKTVDGEWEGAKGLAEDVRYYGKWMRDEAEKRIGHLYPKVKVTAEMAKDRPDLKPYVGKELTVIAWLWARTVASPNPAVNGAHVPLISTYWLSKKKGKEAWISPIIDKEKNTYKFEIKTGKYDQNQADSIGKGTKLGRGASFRCLISGEPISKEHIRTAFSKKQQKCVMTAIVADGLRERIYLPPTEEQITIASSAVPDWRPEDEMNIHTPNLVSGRGYGITHWYELFTNRQLLAITTFSNLVQEARKKALEDIVSFQSNTKFAKTPNEKGVEAESYSDAIATYLGLGIGRMTDICNSGCTWEISKTQVRHLFTRQAIPMVWDFGENNVFGEAAGDYFVSLSNMARVIDRLPKGIPGSVKQLDATAIISNVKKPLISTDPPYYDNIGYSDLSDFFYVWLRPCLNSIYPSIFSTLLTPKKQELIAAAYRHEGSQDSAMVFFETGLGQAFSRMHEAHQPDFPLTVYYAFKQSEDVEISDTANNPTNLVISTGWDTMLTGLIRSGFIIHGTWPLRTELSNRMIGSGTNALASSIVLVCRPRPANAPLATRREFITALKQELPTALKTLQQSSIAPVDLAQAAIGPGMAVFTRYSKVMESDGSPMTVRTALALINQTLDEVLAEQEGEFDPDTRWALAWFEQFGMNDGAFGTAETLSKAKNTAINALVEDGLITARAGKVKLVPRNELPEDWDPAADRRLTAWESTQHLIRALEQKGESGAAELLKQLGSGMGESARDLAYRLYVICDRKKWTTEALSYNGLITSWSEIQNLVHAAERSRIGQQTLAGEKE